ncbi:Uncharacterised protein [Yersinia frederiksenii]|nr:Uncharacterised protein [Yersinia frederiksenii]
MAVSVFSTNQQPQRKSYRMAQSLAIPPPMLWVMAEISSSWWTSWIPTRDRDYPYSSIGSSENI